MAKRTRVDASARRAPRSAASNLTPSGYEAHCHALLVYAAPAVTDDARALAVAEAAVQEAIGPGHVLQPLGAGARDYRVTRGDGRPFDPGRAWALARRLADHRDIADAEPALEQPGLEPPPTALDDGPRLAPFDTSAATPLPCAATTPEWSLDLCRVKQAWALTPSAPGGRTHGEGIRVGHPDTGYTKHAEIWETPSRVLAEESFDFVRREADAVDRLERGNPGHGTTTASVIMSGIGGADAQAFVSGLAPRASLLPLRVTASVVLLAFDRLAEAIRYATDHGCHVISMSLGGPVPSRALERAIADAVERGVIVLAAAGNVWPWVVYPARLDQVVACAACNCQSGVWKQSASGDTVDVTAPGESVWVARPGASAATEDDLVSLGSGTSYAVATTAGACALWLAFHGRDALVARYGASQLAAVFKEVLMTQGVRTPPGWKTDKHGAGILDVEALLRAPLPATPPAAGLRIRASAAPRAENDLDRLMPYFPGAAPEKVRRGLVRLLDTTDQGLPTRLAEFGDELIFHVATNPEVRSRVLRPAPPKKRGRRLGTASPRAGLRVTTATTSRLQREASPALLALLQP